MDVKKQKYVAPRRRFRFSAYVILTAVQERIIGSAFDDETIRERDTPKSLKAENNRLPFIGILIG